MQYGFSILDARDEVKMRQEALLRDARHVDAGDAEVADRLRFFRQYRMRSMLNRYVPGLAARMFV